MSEDIALSSQQSAGRHQINTLVATATSRRAADRDRARKTRVDGLVEEIKTAIAGDRQFVRQEFSTDDEAALFAYAASQAGHRVRRIERTVDVYWSDQLPPLPFDDRFKRRPINVDQAITLLPLEA